MTRDMDELEQLFAAARGAEAPSEALMARVLADAAAVQAEARPAPVRAPSGGGTVSGWLSSIGGWFGAGGLAAATVAGLLIGVYAPDSVDSALGGSLSTLGLVESQTLLPGLSDLLPGEGG
jgi:hypothetical protein